MSAFEVHQLTYYFSAKAALQGISFSVESGGFLGIAGPNGSGKSTLLRLLQGTYLPASGRIEVDGRNLQSYSKRELAKKIASVAQRPVFSFPFLARQFVLLGRTPYLNFLRIESSTDRRVVDEAMRQTDCLIFAHRPVSQLSAGELQRVCIAAALAQQPQVLLLDEPTSFLDLRQIAKLSRLLSALQKSGITILCASHDLRLMRRHATRVLLLDEGRQIGFGSFAEVLTEETLAELFEIEQDLHV
jgi:iron complex transport system ATP-binding protein